MITIWSMQSEERKKASVPPIDHEQWQQWMKQARCSTIVRWWLPGSPAGSRAPRPSCCCWVAQPKPTKEHRTLSFRNQNHTKPFHGFAVEKTASWKVLMLRLRNAYLQAIVGLHFLSLDTKTICSGICCISTLKRHKTIIVKNVEGKSCLGSQRWLLSCWVCPLSAGSSTVRRIRSEEEPA